MAESLSINGKEYIPSNVLAVRFNYTPDYIAKLARDEKIIATQVGRQWFVEPGSLETFLQQTEIQKKLRADELRRKRKIEHSLHQVRTEKEEPKVNAFSLEATLQTVAVLGCGLLVGGLGFVASDAEVGVNDFAQGVEETGSTIAEHVFGIKEREELHRGNQLAASAQSERFAARPSAQESRTTSVRYTELPVFPVRDGATTSVVADAPVASESLLETLSESFSDEIVVQEVSGVEMIIPVFKDGEGAVQYQLVPVENNENEYAE